MTSSGPTVQAASQPYKTEAGKHFLRGDYALNDGPPSTWKLRLTNTPGGKPDPHIVGAAVAALGKGFRGQTVDLPAEKRAAVKARVLRAWRAANPGHKPDEVPAVLKASDEVSGVAPPGWKHTVEQMKDHPGISNPFALAWYMKKRGAKPARHAHDASAETAIAQALRELHGRAMPALCVAAARGDSYALTQCLGPDPFVLETRWR